MSTIDSSRRLGRLGNLATTLAICSPITIDSVDNSVMVAIQNHESNVTTYYRSEIEAGLTCAAMDSDQF